MNIKEAIEQLSHCPDPEKHVVCVIDPTTKKAVECTHIGAYDFMDDKPYAALFFNFIPEK